MNSWMTAREVAELALAGVATTKSAVIRQARRGNWPSRPRAGRGGGREYDLAQAALPDRARAELVRRGLIEAPEISDALVEVAGAAESDGKPWGALRGHEHETATARAEVLAALARYRGETGLGKEAARRAFAQAWNAGCIEIAPDVHELVHRVVGQVSARTLARWDAQARETGIAGLAGRRSDCRAGKGRFDRDAELRNLVVAMLVQHPHAGAPKVAQAMRARFGAQRVPPLRTLQHWIATWRRDNASAHLAITHPDAWKSKYRAAAGLADAGIERLNQLWEMDSTPADALLADGRRYAIVGCIDVYSRRLKLQVVPTSSATGIAALLRRCIVDWGVPETVRTDNGADYTSNHISRVLACLSVHQDVTPPFTPEAKPFIERALQTWSHGLLVLVPGYIGHSVADRKAIENRRSFAARFGNRDEAVELRCTAAELQDFCDRWATDLYATTPHGGLNGETPQAVALAWPHAVRRVPDERALDVLLATAPGDGTRVVGKKGLRIDRALYAHPELGAHVGREVRVLYDETDLGRVYVFDVDAGAYLCTAECPERTGIDRAEVAARMRERQREAIKDAKAELRRVARETSVGDIAAEILAERAQANNVTSFPRRTDEHRTPALDAAAEAAAADDADHGPSPERLAEAELVSAQAVQRRRDDAERQIERQRRAREEEADMLAEQEATWRRLRAGQPVGDDELKWFRIRESHPLWQARAAELLAAARRAVGDD